MTPPRERVDVQRCPVNGHDHTLRAVIRHTQDGTGAVGFTWECPTGRYRWFALDGAVVSDATRTVRPRWGWPTVVDGPGHTVIPEPRNGAD